MNQIKMTEYHDYLIYILDEVVDLCKRHHIRYYLDCGTLLGAVRHRGFIPWDDDIDIAMPIKDYKRFIKSCKNELESKNMFLQTFQTDPKVNGMWARVRANGTTSLPVSSYKWDIHWGIHIDVFPLIGLYKNRYFKKIQKKLFDLNTALLQVDQVNGCNLEYKPRKITKILCDLPRRIRHIIVQINNKFIDKDCFKTEYLCAKWGIISNRGKSEWYEKTKDLFFEGKMYCCPSSYDKVLTYYYGDYMQLPPIDKRKGHDYQQGKTIRDIKKDYHYYIKLLENNEQH